MSTCGEPHPEKPELTCEKFDGPHREHKVSVPHEVGLYWINVNYPLSRPSPAGRGKKEYFAEQNKLINAQRRAARASAKTAELALVLFDGDGPVTHESGEYVNAIGGRCPWCSARVRVRQGTVIKWTTGMRVAHREGECSGPLGGS
jgi:hypothetical protein